MSKKGGYSNYTKASPSFYGTPVYLGPEHGLMYKPTMTVEDWLKYGFDDYDMEHYPNAEAAAKIKSSKLYKALK